MWQSCEPARVYAAVDASRKDIPISFPNRSCVSGPPADTLRNTRALRFFHSITTLRAGSSHSSELTVLTAFATGTYIEGHELRSATPRATRRSQRKLDVGCVPQKGRGLLAPRTAFAVLCPESDARRSADCSFIDSDSPSSRGVRRCSHGQRGCDALAPGRGPCKRTRRGRGG